VHLLAACSLGGAGHLNPLAPFLTAARRRGEEVLVVAPPEMREMVEGLGLPFFPGAQPPEEEVAPIRELLPVVPRQEASILASRELFGRLATRAMLPKMDEAFAEYRPDVVLRDPCEYSSAIVASRREIRVAQVAISLAELEAAAIAAAAPALGEQQEGLAEDLLGAPYLSRFPTSLDPSTFPVTVRFREAGASTLSPLPDWWNGSDAPLVYLTFGTVLGHMSIALEVYRAALEAMRGLEARVLLTVGRKLDPSGLGQVPSNVHVEQWVDQARVMGEADVVVCHGGSGTVLGALAAGVPLVMVPLFADQFDNARRIAATGAGTSVEVETEEPMGRHRQLSRDDAPRISEQVREVLSDSTYRDQARLIAEEMGSAPTVDAVLGDLLLVKP